MIGRMSSLQLNQGSLSVILEAQARLQRTQEELASGTNILTPSDDPVSSARIMAVQSELSRIETYQRNADVANQELRLTEDTLASIEDVLLRVKQLAVQGNNGTLNDQDKRTLAQEISGLGEQLVSISKSKSISGEFIFSGSRTDLAPFEEIDGEMQYVGDDLLRSVNLAPAISFETRISGEAVFGVSGTGDQTLFETLSLLENTLSDTDLSGDQFAGAMSSALNSLSEGFERVSSQRATLGTKMNRVDEQIRLNDSFNLRLQETLSGLKDLDYAKAISDMNLQMVALEAAQKAYTNTQGMSLFNYL